MFTNLRLMAAIGAGVLILGLIAALLMTRATLATAKVERDTAELKLKSSNESIGQLETSLARVQAQQQELANSDANRIEASRQVIEMAEAASQLRQVAIDRLLSSAETVRESGPQCEASDTVKELWPA